MTTDQPGGTGEAASIAAAMAAADALKIIVRPLLEALRGPGAADIAAGLRPRSEDCARVFVAEAVEPAREAYARLWDGAPPFKRPDSLRSVLEIFVAPAGMFG